MVECTMRICVVKVWLSELMRGRKHVSTYSNWHGLIIALKKKTIPNHICQHPFQKFLNLILLTVRSVQLNNLSSWQNRTQRAHHDRLFLDAFTIRRRRFFFDFSGIYGCECWIVTMWYDLWCYNISPHVDFLNPSLIWNVVVRVFDSHT